jgi:hypothetical protein
MIWTRRTMIVAALGLVASCSAAHVPPADGAGCAKDADCKGERICIVGVCTEPDGTPAGSDANASDVGRDGLGHDGASDSAPSDGGADARTDAATDASLDAPPDGPSTCGSGSAPTCATPPASVCPLAQSVACSSTARGVQAYCNKLCANKCVDLSSDPANCGGCGVACSATETCAGGCCVADTTWKVLGTTTAASYLYVDASNLYYTLSNELWKADKVTFTATLLASGQNFSQLAFDDVNVYWSDAVTNSILRVPVGGGEAAATLYAIGEPRALAVDGDSLYWADWAGGAPGAGGMASIKKAPKDPTGAPTVLLSTVGAYRTVAPRFETGGARIFGYGCVTDFGAMGRFGVDTTTGAVTSLAPCRLQHPPTGLFNSSRHRDYVYWLDTVATSNVWFRAEYTGAGAPPANSRSAAGNYCAPNSSQPCAPRPYAVVADECNAVYWVGYNSTPGRARGIWKLSPGTLPRRVAEPGSGNTAGALAVDEKYLYWAGSDSAGGGLIVRMPRP